MNLGAGSHRMSIGDQTAALGRRTRNLILR